MACVSNHRIMCKVLVTEIFGYPIFGSDLLSASNSIPSIIDVFEIIFDYHKLFWRARLSRLPRNYRKQAVTRVSSRVSLEYFLLKFDINRTVNHFGISSYYLVSPSSAPPSV